jgi:hypothetical protein
MLSNDSGESGGGNTPRRLLLPFPKDNMKRPEFDIQELPIRHVFGRELKLEPVSQYKLEQNDTVSPVFNHDSSPKPRSLTANEDELPQLDLGYASNGFQQMLEKRVIPKPEKYKDPTNPKDLGPSGSLDNGLGTSCRSTAFMLREPSKN